MVLTFERPTLPKTKLLDRHHLLPSLGRQEHTTHAAPSCTGSGGLRARPWPTAKQPIHEAADGLSGMCQHVHYLVGAVASSLMCR
jgi:hypothetical protein